MISTETSLQLLSQEFWQNYPWLGRQNSSLPSNKQTLNTNKIEDWSSHSIQDFFQNANWQGLQNNLISKVAKQINLEISLTTADFFQCFAWEGKPKIAQKLTSQNSTVMKNLSGAAKQSTLSDLSQLF